MLLALAIIMGGVFLVIAYTYNLQKETERNIEISRATVDEAKEMENELTAIKGLTFTYMVNKSDIWLDSLRGRQTRFTFHLERARRRANTPEELFLIQQISALFSNYRQNILQASSFLKNGDINRANTLIANSAQNLLETIQQKSNEFISINVISGARHQDELARSNLIILKILISLGIGGIAAGILLGWLISRLLFAPISKLVLKVRGASGEALFEQLTLPYGGELDELGERIKQMIDKINRANEDLSRNKELLQYSNKYANLGKIAPTIAHEIRNPLAAINMLVYSIREDRNTPDSIKEDLDIISLEIDRIDNFTKDFLKFAKPADPVFALIDPCESLNDVIKLLKPRLFANNISIVNSIVKCKWSVMADTSHLKQIYMNIILNAIEVMPNGGELTVSVTKEAEIISHEINSKSDISGKRYICIAIADTGPGIPDAIINRLFEPYIKGSDMGVGIGLSISQGIALAHGGFITAENRISDKGAVFKINLPLCE